jgi:DnaJ-class molecular chaperone
MSDRCHLNTCLPSGIRAKIYKGGRNGIERRLRLMAKETCDACGMSLSNEIMGVIFPDMPGTGQVECDGCSGRGEDDEGETCRLCDGDGKVRCPKCGGTGLV